MFNGYMTAQDKDVYKEYSRLVEILTTDEYNDMYSKIGAIRAKMKHIEKIMITDKE